MVELYTSEVFLNKDDIAILTGRKVRSKQVEQLRKMKIPFWVNAIGAPVVARSAIEGRREAPLPPKKIWVMPK